MLRLNNSKSLLKRISSRGDKFTREARLRAKMLLIEKLSLRILRKSKSSVPTKKSTLTNSTTSETSKETSNLKSPNSWKVSPETTTTETIFYRPLNKRRSNMRPPQCPTKMRSAYFRRLTSSRERCQTWRS